MQKLVALVVCLAVASMFVVGCKKKEMPPAPKVVEMPQGIPNPHGDPSQKTTRKIVVPDEIKRTWSKVVLIIEDKKTNSKSEYTAAIGSEFAIPGSEVKVKVGEFLPQFMIDGDKITSASNELKNPAVRVEVTEKGNVIFNNWLFAKYADVHSFEHPRYRLALKEALKK